MDGFLIMSSQLPLKGTTVIQCAVCGKTVKKKNFDIARGAKYCSLACYHQSQLNPREQMSCETCGSLIVWDGHPPRPRFCSQKCFGQSLSKSKTVVCHQCGNPFPAQNRSLARGQGKFCSKECYRLSMIVSISEKPCEVCGKAMPIKNYFRWEKRYCSWKCRVVGMVGERNPNWNNNKSYRGPQWDTIREEILRRDNYTCQHCGSPDDLAVHHIVHWRKTRNNQPENLITLCRACHSREHYGEFIGKS